MRRLIPYAITLSLSLASLAAWGCNGSSQNTITTPNLDNVPTPDAGNSLTPPSPGNATSDDDDVPNRPIASGGPGGGNDPGNPGNPGGGSGSAGPGSGGNNPGTPPPGSFPTVGAPDATGNPTDPPQIVTYNCDGEQITFTPGDSRLLTLPKGVAPRDNGTFNPNVLVNGNPQNTSLTGSISATAVPGSLDAWISRTSGIVGLEFYTANLAIAITTQDGCVGISSATFTQSGGQDPAELAESWVLPDTLAIAANPYDYEVGESNVVEVRRPGTGLGGGAVGEFVSWTWTIAEEWTAPSGAILTRIDFTHETIYGEQANFSFVWSSENGIVAIEDPFFYPIDGEGTPFLYTFRRL